ncbi:MAG: LysM peptidoglycan-binding domain-containing protein, partial [Alistipes sp.]|nr:LysM peptidoglycan-binding domain-containing protein [Alistipes sp.]
LDGELDPGLDSLQVGNEVAETAVTDAAAGATELAVKEPSAEEPAAPEPVYHRIVSGDTLLALALRYDTSVARLCELNGITRTTTLRIGRRLRIK